MLSFNLGEILPHYEVPVHYILGENDNITPTALSKAYFDTIDAPLKTIAMIPAAGHNPMYERPEECPAALRTVRETVLRYYLGHMEKSL